MPDCAHHWLIEAPQGGELLKARCKRCRKRRTFPAAPEPVFQSLWKKRKPALPHAEAGTLDS